MNNQQDNRLNQVMNMLHVRANALAAESGADHSLITKWRRGERRLTKNSKNLYTIAESLLDFDSDGKLAALIAPYKAPAETNVETLVRYLVGHDLPDLPPRIEPVVRRTSGEYTVQHRVYLGEPGFRNATVALFDYIAAIPPGRNIAAVCHGNYEWIIKNPVYTHTLITSMKKAFERGATLSLINRKGYAIADSAVFATPWLLAHLHGYIRSRYYEGPLPDKERIVATIKDYCSLRAVLDDAVEDQLYVSLFTDYLNIHQDMRTCDFYYGRSKALSQYAFLQKPTGYADTELLWDKNDELMAWEKGPRPDGSFYTFQRFPCFGVMTREEAQQLRQKGDPELPAFMFLKEPAFAAGPHKLILCLEDVRYALANPSSPHGALRELLQRPISLSNDLSRQLIQRIVKAMDAHPDFEVALVPRAAFKTLEMEMISWKESVTVSWLQDHRQSMLSCDESVSGALYASMNYIWDCLLAGWKRQSQIKRTLRKWLAGKELDTKLVDSAIVRGWNIYSRRINQ